MTRQFILIWLLSASLLSNAQIRVESSTNDLGDIFEDGGVVLTTFKLQNPYFSDTIRILDISTSCGCMAILSNDSIILPRKVAELKITYDPADRVGLFAKSIHIKTQTGPIEQNSLYLKIVGNVIGETQVSQSTPINLIEYRVAPIYFYPVTGYDTSFFSMSKIEEFVNDISFEIDYYNFTTLGFEIRLKDRSLVEHFEVLSSYFKYKFIRELELRGYTKENITFINPVIIFDNKVPAWSIAKLKVYSLKFNDDKLKRSVIRLTNEDAMENGNFVGYYNSEVYPHTDSLLKSIDQKDLEGRLFKQGQLNLKGTVLVPESVGVKAAKKIAKKLSKALYRSLKSTTGVSKKEYNLSFESTDIHAATKYKVELWDAFDTSKATQIRYIEKNEDIVAPLLPTYKTRFFLPKQKINEKSVQFAHFWETIVSYASTGKNLQLIVESSTSNYPKKPYNDPLVVAKEKGETVVEFIKEKYKREVGKELDVRLVTCVQGPEFETQNFTQPEYFKYEYINLVPVFLTPREIEIPPIEPKPYIVNYDYYYIGVSVESPVFQRFCDYLIYEIQTNGFVEIRTESSASNLIVDSRKSNEYWAHSHMAVSKERLFKYLKSKLIDPNRVIISNEKIVVQGIPYDPKTPVVRYKKFQYVTFIPTKYL